MIQTIKTKTSREVIDFKLTVNTYNFFFIKSVEHNNNRVFKAGHINMATHMHQAYDKKEFGKKVERVRYLIYLF